MYSVNDIWFFTICVSTFRNPRIEAYLQLPVAYRSLSRLSSAPDAKAFSLCSCLLELLLMYILLYGLYSFSLSRIAELLKNSLFLVFYSPFTQLLVWLNCNFFTLNLKLYLERPFFNLFWFQNLSFSLLIYS